MINGISIKQQHLQEYAHIQIQIYSSGQLSQSSLQPKSFQKILAVFLVNSFPVAQNWQKQSDKVKNI